MIRCVLDHSVPCASQIHRQLGRANFMACVLRVMALVALVAMATPQAKRVLERGGLYKAIGHLGVVEGAGGSGLPDLQRFRLAGILLNLSSP